MKEKIEREHILYDLDSGMQGCIQVYFTRTRARAHFSVAAATELCFQSIRYDTYMRIRPELICESRAA